MSGSFGIGWRHPHYSELLQRQPVLDFLEVHSENFFAQGGAALAVLTTARRDYPISLHGVGLSLGSATGLDDWHLDRLDALVRRVDPVRVSDHASFARGQVGGTVVHGADLLPVPFTTEALDVMCDHVQQVQDRLQRRFMVENISSYLQWAGDADAPEPDIPEPAFLARLAQRTGCSLLVDVNNIYVNALNAAGQSGAGFDPVRQCLRWLDQIPAAAVGEVHLAGHCHVSDEHGDIVIDDHGSRVCEAVWRIYRHAVQRFGAVPTLIEWDTAIPALDVLLDEAGRARTASTQARESVA